MSGASLNKEVMVVNGFRGVNVCFGSEFGSVFIQLFKPSAQSQMSSTHGTYKSFLSVDIIYTNLISLHSGLLC